MLRSISSNWTLNALQILVFMMVTPFARNIIGDEGYGIWEVIVAMSGPLQLLSLGLPMATVRALSSALASGDKEAATKALGTSLSLTMVLGAVALLLGSVAYWFFTGSTMQGEGWEGVTAPERSAASIALIMMLANVAMGFALKLPYAIFDAHQDFVARNLIMAGGLITRLAATFAFLSWRADLPTFAGIQIGIAVLEFVVAMGVSRARHPFVRFRPAKIEWLEAKSLLSFSLFAFLLNMGALLAFRIDALVIGNHLDIPKAAIYGDGNRIFDPFIQILLGIGMVLMPMAATESRKGNLGAVRDAFLKWSKIATTIVMLIGGYLIVLGPNFLEAWLGDVYSPTSGRILQILMASFFFFLPVRGVALPVLMGLGHAKIPGFGLLAMGILNLVISLALVGEYGVLGVAAGTAIPNVLFSALFVFEACRRVDMKVSDWLQYALGRLLPATILCCGALALVASQVPLHGFPSVIAAGIVYTALFGALAVGFVFRDDPFLDTRALTAKVRARFR